MLSRLRRQDVVLLRTLDRLLLRLNVDRHRVARISLTRTVGLLINVISVLRLVRRPNVTMNM